MKFYNTLPEENETVINIDYFTRVLNIYTSRKSIIQRLYNKLGEPNKADYINNTLTGARWAIKFEDKKRINIALSRPTLIGQMK